MCGGRGGRFLVLVAPVLLGLLAMHAFVAPAGASAAADHGGMATSTSVTHEPSGSSTSGSSTSGADAMAIGHVDVGPAPGAAATGSGHPGPAGHDVAGHLLHLCLAVLAALGAVLLAARVFPGRLPLSAPVATPSHGWSVPAGRPPPVPRRLATLCVLRN